MAACGRIGFILLLLAHCSSVFSGQGLRQQANGNPHPPVVSLNRQLKLGVSNSLNVVGAVAAAAVSQGKRVVAWKLAEEEACRSDIIRLCPKHTWNNNLAVLECLQDRKEVSWTCSSALLASVPCFVDFELSQLFGSLTLTCLQRVPEYCVVT